MLVAGSCEAGPGLCLEHIQEGCIAVRPAIQAAEVCATCSSATSSSLVDHPGRAMGEVGQALLVPTTVHVMREEGAVGGRGGGVGCRQVLCCNQLDVA